MARMFRRQMAGSGRRAPLKIRLVIALGIALFAIVSYYLKSDVNQVTGEKQRVDLTEKQEIVLGLQAMPEIIRKHQGEHPDQKAQAYVDQVGFKLLTSLEKRLQKEGRKNPYQFDFHLLKDEKVINAFALPGGQVFLTAALYKQLETEGQLAGVLGHEIGHVISRHGAQQMAKRKLTQGLTGAATMASGEMDGARMAQMIGSLMNMKYGRNDELQSDEWGVKLCVGAGYDPNAMIGVMKILERSSGGSRQPEFMSTHPNPGNRIEKIEAFIKKLYPKRLPDGLEP
jgi:beta-barrel assembly-enhancing protease